uniref:Uncharacterized protein n=1 Tax=Nelumbo nucifera TaxID=4432 RepID=A0A823A1H0_NELNU|nr:TPA_asm: hypothetical protein HUJ06_017945 [Nelumbo nucifera]
MYINALAQLEQKGAQGKIDSFLRVVLSDHFPVLLQHFQQSLECKFICIICIATKHNLRCMYINALAQLEQKGAQGKIDSFLRVVLSDHFPVLLQHFQQSLAPELMLVLSSAHYSPYIGILTHPKKGSLLLVENTSFTGADCPAIMTKCC